MEKSVWCSSALHFACSCHNCHILMTPPSLPPAPLFSLAQSTAMNDSMDTPYRELFLGDVECTPLGYCLNFSCLPVFCLVFFAPPPHRNIFNELWLWYCVLNDHLKDKSMADGVVKVSSIMCKRLKSQYLMGVVIKERKVVLKSLLPAHPQGLFEIRCEMMLLIKAAPIVRAPCSVSSSPWLLWRLKEVGNIADSVSVCACAYVCVCVRSPPFLKDAMGNAFPSGYGHREHRASALLSLRSSPLGGWKASHRAPDFPASKATMSSYLSFLSPATEEGKRRG